MELLKTYGYDFVGLTSRLHGYIQMLAYLVESSTNKDVDITAVPEVAPELDQWFDQAGKLCEELNLRSTLDLIWQIKADKPWVGRPFVWSLTDVGSRMESELRQVNFLLVPLSKVAFYDQPIFGEEVETRFPDAISDIREAGTCYALGCSTAVVHHCMGIVQVGIIELAKHLGISLDIHVDDWNSMITKIEGAVARLKKAALSDPNATDQMKSDWRKREAFYSEVSIDVRRIKDAWRNPDAHFRKPFDDQKAKKVLDTVSEFMRNLTDGLR